MTSNLNRRRWTREESLIVFNLYCRIPFKDSNKAHPDVIYIAGLIDRTPDAVNMKIGNFGSLDPELQKRGILGLRNSTKLDQMVWDEFHQNWEELIEESQRLISDREVALTGSASTAADNREDETPALREGRERVATVSLRQNQSFFRRAILSAYENRCCLTGIDIETLLNASHIKPWVESNKTEKLNPQNGLCLNVFHDRAFDRGLITFTDDFAVVVSDRVTHTSSDAVRKMLLSYSGQKMQLPSRFAPRSDFMAWHRENVFAG